MTSMVSVSSSMAHDAMLRRTETLPPAASSLLLALSDMDEFQQCLAEVSQAIPYDLKELFRQFLEGLGLPYSWDVQGWTAASLVPASELLTLFCTDDGHGELCGTVLERNLHNTISHIQRYGPPVALPTCSSLHDRLGCCLGELEILALQAVNSVIDPDEPIERSDLQCGVQNCEERSKRLRGAAIAGIVLGSVFLAAALVCGCFCCVRLSKAPRRRNREYIVVSSSTNIYQ
mmetsp:Transcript_4977/g.18038  ORF Transcript_4977/g.18038 Transcript_4977/m.18038 type:complete len:232 (-) Transcript_4977:117-812(-)